MELYYTWPLGIDSLYYKESEEDDCKRQSVGDVIQMGISKNIKALLSKENIRGWLYGLTEDFYRNPEFAQKAPMAVYQREGYDKCCDFVEYDMTNSESSFFCSKLRVLDKSTECCRKIDRYISNLFLGKTKKEIKSLSFDNFNDGIYQVVSECRLATRNSIKTYLIKYEFNEDNNEFCLIYKCPRTFMTEIAFPILFDGKVIAVLIVGQFVNRSDIGYINDKIGQYNENAVGNQSVEQIKEDDKVVREQKELEEIIKFFQRKIRVKQFDLEERFSQNENDLTKRITEDIYNESQKIDKSIETWKKSILQEVKNRISAERIILFNVTDRETIERVLEITVESDTNESTAEVNFKLGKNSIAELKADENSLCNDNIILTSIKECRILHKTFESIKSNNSFFVLLNDTNKLRFAFFISFGFSVSEHDRKVLMNLLPHIGKAFFENFDIIDEEKKEYLRKYKIRKDYAKARNALIKPYAYHYHIYHDAVVTKLLFDANLRDSIRSDVVSIQNKMSLLQTKIDNEKLDKEKIVPIVNDIICDYDPDNDLYNVKINNKQLYLFTYSDDVSGEKSKKINIRPDNCLEGFNCDIIVDKAVHKAECTEFEPKLTIEIVSLLESMRRDIDLPFEVNKTYGKYSLKMDKDLLLILLIDIFETSSPRLLQDMYKITATKAFRHLQYKTQVMMNSFSDDQTTRLMHSMAVSSIASTLAKQFHANWELAEAIALGHDVGHTPFGHAGEEALDKCLQSMFYGRFQHALQGVKVLNNYEKHRSMERYGLHGIGISKELLIGILNHDTDMMIEDINRAGFKLQYDIENHLGNVDKNGNIETQIVYWSDKIAYLGHDWEEFSNSEIMEDFYNTVNDIYHSMIEVYNTFGGNNFETIKTDNKHELELINKIVTLVNDSVNESVIKPTNKSVNEAKNKSANETKNKAAKESANKPTTDVENMKKIDLERFVIRLEKMVLDYKSIENERIEASYISCNHYDKFVFFFKIADAWSRLLKREIIARPFANDSFLQIIHDFLVNIKADQVALTLQSKIVAYSYGDVVKIMTRRAFNECSEEKKKRTMEKYDFKEGDKDSIKKIYPEMLMITMDPYNGLNHIRTIKEFISNYYHDSVLVKRMNMKAKHIVEKLFEHYTKEPKMLPPEYRQKYYKYKELNTMNKNDMPVTNKRQESEISCLLRRNLEEVSNDSQLKKVVLTDENCDVLKDLIAAHVKRCSDPDQKWDRFVERAIIGRIAADYIASMTDRMAIKKFNEFNASELNWSYVDK